MGVSPSEKTCLAGRRGLEGKDGEGPPGPHKGVQGGRILKDGTMSRSVTAVYGGVPRNICIPLRVEESDLDGGDLNNGFECIPSKKPDAANRPFLPRANSYFRYDSGKLVSLLRQK
jgi:hypothetical protein